MKKINNYLIFIVVTVTIISTSCSTTKQVMTENTVQNSYVIIKNPSSESKMTTFSLLMAPVTSLGGVAIGYEVAKNMPPTSDGYEVDADQIAAYGFIAGAASWVIGNWITNAIFTPNKKGTPKNEYEASVWLKKYNKKTNNDLLLVSFKNNELVTIPRKYQNTFIARSLDDFKNYIKTFPNSLHTPNVYKSALSHLTYDQIIEIMSLYSDERLNEITQDELLKKCTSINQCIEISNKYPRLIEQADKKTASLVTNLPDVMKYRENFKEGKYSDIMINNVIRHLNRNDLKKLINLYPNEQSINQAKKQYLYSSKYFHQAYDAVCIYKELKNQGESFLLRLANNDSQKMMFAKLYPNNVKAKSFQKKFDKKIAEKLFRYCFNYIYLVKEEGTQLFDFWDDSNVEDIIKGKKLSYVLYNANDLVFQIADNNMQGMHYKLGRNNKATKTFETDYGYLTVQSKGWLNYGNDVSVNKAVATIKFNAVLKNQNRLDHKKIIILRIGEFDQSGIINGEFQYDNHELFLYVDGNVSPNAYNKIKSILKNKIDFETEFNWFLRSTSKSSPHMTTAQKEFIEGEILHLSGLDVDISNANKAYKKFTDPNRLLETYEVRSGYMKFPDATKGMKLGQILKEFTKRIKPLCTNTAYCDIAAKNMFYTLLATNAIRASKNMSSTKKLEILKLGLYINELYKKDIRNQSISLYELMIKEIDLSIYGVRNNKSIYSPYHNPTADFVMSLSKEETVAILAGLVGIGATISLSWAQQLCRNTDCSLLSYSSSNSSGQSPQKSSNTKISSVSKVDTNKTPDVNNELQIIEDGTHKYGSYTAVRYKIICPNGHKNFIYYNEQKKCWMKTSSAFCDYSSTKGPEGLKKSAKILCDNN